MVSDWDAQQAGDASSHSGLDMVMPNGDKYWGQQLRSDVLNDKVPEARLDDMVHR